MDNQNNWEELMYLLEESPPTIQDMLDTPPPTGLEMDNQTEVQMEQVEAEVQTVSTLVQGVQLSERNPIDAEILLNSDPEEEISVEEIITVETEVVSDPDWDAVQTQRTPPAPPSSPEPLISVMNKPKTNIYHQLMIAEGLVGARTQELNSAAQRLKAARDEVKKAKAKIRAAVNREHQPSGSRSRGVRQRKSESKKKSSEISRHHHTHGYRYTKAGGVKGRSKAKKPGPQTRARRRTPSRPSSPAPRRAQPSPEREELKAKIKEKEEQIRQAEKQMKKERKKKNE